MRPAVAGFQLTPCVRASDINFDHDVPSTERGKEQGNVTKLTGALVVGMEYAVRGSAGSVAEVAFTPTTSLCDGLDPDTLTPTVYVKCLLGSCLFWDRVSCIDACGCLVGYMLVYVGGIHAPYVHISYRSIRWPT